MTGPTATPGVARCRTCGDQISEADIRRSATPADAKSCANVSCSVDRNGPTGRVEMWRGGSRSGLSVAAPFVWRCPCNLAVAPFPHPAHRTGRADLPHPALGQGACFCPRKVALGLTEQQQGRVSLTAFLTAEHSQPPMRPPGPTSASRTKARVFPSLQHVTPAAALVPLRSLLGLPQSPALRHFQRQP